MLAKLIYIATFEIRLWQHEFQHIQAREQSVNLDRCDWAFNSISSNSLLLFWVSRACMNNSSLTMF